jgi:DNA-binding response OmpR family regulator
MPSFTQYRVLVVDDDENVSKSVALLFTGQGWEAQVAGSAEEAIELTAQWKPDLAILDIVLPGMNGIDLAGYFTTNLSLCRVLLFSGQPSTADLLKEAEAQGSAYQVLAKPVPPRELLEMAARLMENGC